MDAFGAFQTAGLMASSKGDIITQTASDYHWGSADNRFTGNCVCTINSERITASLIRILFISEFSNHYTGWIFMIPSQYNANIFTISTTNDNTMDITVQVTSNLIKVQSGPHILTVGNGQSVYLYVSAFILRGS